MALTITVVSFSDIPYFKEVVIMATVCDYVPPKKEHYSNFYTFEIATFLNVPGHYSRKYGISNAL